MNNRDEGNWIDRFSERLAVGMAAKTSRRSLLGRASIPLLALLGAGSVSMGPVTRKASARSMLAGSGPIEGCYYPAGTTVADKSLCAMTGSPCTTCTDSELDFSGDCPTIKPGSEYDSVGNSIQRCGSWTGCCAYGDGGALRPVIYVDCCAFGFSPAPSCSTTCNNQASCEKGKAENGVVYCDKSLCSTDSNDRPYYVCTYVSKPTGACL